MICNIKLQVADPTFFLKSRHPLVDWKEVDRTLEQFAHKLERFTIIIDPNNLESEQLRDTLPKYFPKLGKEVVSVNLARW